jgi:ataxia telangiectasia mutated family protein
LTRLKLCGEIIRDVVDVGAHRLQLKTSGAIASHIVQTLPCANDEYCQPLIEPYLKALGALLDQTANAERLSKGKWVDIVDFCLVGIGQCLDHLERESKEKELSSIPRGSSGSGRPLASRSIARTTSSNNNAPNQTSVLSRNNAGDLLHVLHALMAPTNAPISARHSEILDLVLGFWKIQGTSPNQHHQLIISIINRLTEYTRTNQLLFTQSTARTVIPIISQFWQGKNVAKDEMLNSIRDEMLVFLFFVHPHLERSLRDDEEGDFPNLVEDLSDTLRADYTKRSEKDQLGLDDMEMVDLSMDDSGSTPFRLDTFQLRPHNIRAERNWAILQTIGTLEWLVSLSHRQEEVVDSELEKHPRKRQKVARRSDRIIDPLKSGEERLRLAGLQALPFILVNYELTKPELIELLNQLQICASDKRGSIAAWALLAISRQAISGNFPALVLISLP